MSRVRDIRYVKERRYPYDDDVELGVVKLAGRAFELEAGRLHLLGGEAVTRGPGVVAVDGGLTDIHTDDALHVLEKGLRDESYSESAVHVVSNQAQSTARRSRCTYAACKVHDGSALLVEELGPLRTEGFDLLAGHLAPLRVHLLECLCILVVVRLVRGDEVMGVAVVTRCGMESVGVVMVVGGHFKLLLMTET